MSKSPWLFSGSEVAAFPKPPLCPHLWFGLIKRVRTPAESPTEILKQKFKVTINYTVFWVFGFFGVWWWWCESEWADIWECFWRRRLNSREKLLTPTSKNLGRSRTVSRAFVLSGNASSSWVQRKTPQIKWTWRQTCFELNESVSDCDVCWRANTSVYLF